MQAGDKLIHKASMLMVKGKYQEASRLYQKVLAKDPHNVSALYNRAVILHKYGNTRESIKLLRQTVKLARDFPEAHLSLASNLFEVNQLDDAANHYRTAIALKPSLDRAHFRLGNICEIQGAPEQAERLYRRCLELAAEQWEYALAYGRILLHQGRHKDAYPHLSRAVRLNPDHADCWEQFGRCFLMLETPSVDRALIDALTKVLDGETVNARSLAALGARMVRGEPALQPLYQLAEDSQAACSQLAARLAGGEDFAPLQHPLLLALMKTTTVVDAGLERALTRLRQILLELATTPSAALLSSPAGSEFLAALAACCFHNEYVFVESAQETSALEGLRAELAEAVQRGAEIPHALLALLGCYRNLSLEPFAEQLAALIEWPPTIATLIDRQVRAPLLERQLAQEIVALTPIDDQVSQRVREQYEENPYPRWRIGSLAGRSPAPLAATLHQLFPHVDPQQLPNPKRLDVLVAGCGTGKHALQVAQRYSNANVLAIDLSRASLAYAIRSSRQLGVKNVSFRQADILQLGGIGEKFHHIECAGVLHHMQNPVAGWKCLLERLHRGGVMSVDLYSEIGRKAVVKAREIIAAQNLSENAAEIRRFRQQVIAGEVPADLAELLNFRDFFTTSECRDLLFHRQEHRFTLLQIREICEELNLEFLGFELHDSAYALRYRARFPGDPHLTSLENWHLFEQEHPALFSSMYPMWFKRRDY